MDSRSIDDTSSDQSSVEMMPTNGSNDDDNKNNSSMTDVPLDLDDHSTSEHNVRKDEQKDASNLECKVFKNEQQNKEFPGLTATSSTVLRKDYIAKALQDASYGSGSEHDINETLLYRAVCSAGAWAYGVMACEVWVLDNAKGDELVRPDGGIWRDMVWPSTDALERLEDAAHPKYEAPTSLAAGEGLAGALWAEADTTFGNRGETFIDRIKAEFHGEDESDDDEENGRPDIGDLFKFQRKVVWRNVAALAADPDQPPNKRLALWAKAGFGLAAGVAFEVRGVKGIVVYMARESACMERLQSEQNEAYLISAADLIGAEAALGEARADAIRVHREHRAAALRRAKMKIRTVLFMLRMKKQNGTLGALDLNDIAIAASPAKYELNATGEERPPSTAAKYATIVKTWGGRQLTKAKGKDMDPPPPMQPDMALQTFCFCFITLLIIFRFNKWLTGASTGDLSILLGPVGAIATMHYTLMAAPASQPRNAIYGQFVSMSIGMCISYIPHLGTQDWIRPAISTALAATSMVLLGITHPPGGATAIVFSSGKFGWAHVGLLLFAYCMAICCSTILNNLTERRQYPMYWSFVSRDYRAKLRELVCPTKAAPSPAELENEQTEKSVTQHP